MGSELLRRAEAIRVLDRAVHDTHGTDEHAENARQLLALLHATLAPYNSAMDSLSAGSFADLDLALDFLETRPRFHRSGYTTERLLRRVGRLRLTGQQGARIHQVLQSIAAEQPSREQRLAARLLSRLQKE